MALKLLIVFLYALTFACSGGGGGGEEEPQEETGSSTPTQVAGFSLMQCSAYTNEDNPNNSQVACTITNDDDGTRFEGPIDNLNVQIMGPDGVPISPEVSRTGDQADPHFVFDWPADSVEGATVFADFESEGQAYAYEAIIEALVPLAPINFSLITHNFGTHAMRQAGSPINITLQFDQVESPIQPKIVDVRFPEPFGFPETAHENRCELLELLEANCVIDIVFTPTKVGNFPEDETQKVEVEVVNGPNQDVFEIEVTGMGRLIATQVIGQPDFSSSVIDNGGLANGGLNNPYSIFVSGNRTWIADYGNHRIWQNNDGTTAAIGQPSNGDETPGTNDSTLWFPASVVANSGALYVADFFNNRVAVWGSETPTGSSSYSYQVGQANDTSRVTGTDYNRFNKPSGISIQGSNVILTDSLNHRVLQYTTFPPASAADVKVVGQADETSNSSGTTAQLLNTPTYAEVYSGDLFVADTQNNRVLIWENIGSGWPESTDASKVIGQGDFTSSSSGVTNTTFNNPVHVTSMPSSTGETMVFVTDKLNSRILIFPSNETGDFSNGAAAAFVMGQDNLNSNSSRTGANGLNSPSSVFLDISNSVAYVADSDNHRILVVPLPADDWGAMP